MHVCGTVSGCFLCNASGVCVCVCVCVCARVVMGILCLHVDLCACSGQSLGFCVGFHSLLFPFGDSQDDRKLQV